MNPETVTCWQQSAEFTRSGQHGETGLDRPAGPSRRPANADQPAARRRGPYSRCGDAGDCPVRCRISVNVAVSAGRERSRTAPYGSVRLTDVDILAEVDPANADINDGAFHLVRRHFDVQAFGVNAVTGDAGDEMIEEHHETDDEENETNGHQELYVVMTGHALFTVDGEKIDAPAGTIVFVRDPALLRAARATADDTAIFCVGGPARLPTPSRAGKHPSRNHAPDEPLKAQRSAWGAVSRPPTEAPWPPRLRTRMETIGGS